MDFDKQIEKERKLLDLQEVKEYTKCDRCNAEIYVGNEYYFYERCCLCEECFDEIQHDEKIKHRRIAGDEDE